MAGSPDATLWRYVLALYARPGVAEACLVLQDDYGQDVCLVLFALWAGAVCRHRLTAAELVLLDGAAAEWRHQVVVPLRTLRRRLKHGPPPAPDRATGRLRRRLQAAEIDAERIALANLLATLPLSAATDDGDAAGRAGRAAANLALLCPQAPEALRRLLAGAA